MIEPNAIVLYVEDLALSSEFYTNLLGLSLEEDSPTFHSFTLSKGMGLGLKAKHSVPETVSRNSCSELAFILENKDKVDELFAEWQKKEIEFAQGPSDLAYGYAFVALDPDGNRLRVVSLQKI
ncbi:MAG: VOC family protein [Tatlockia sp.]|nr:VOC family protein [Tatlockia sp.]